MQKALAARVHYVDNLKGLAIIFVVLGHVLDGYISAGCYSSAETSFRMIYNAIYNFHMPLLFIISGYVYWLSYCEKTAFYRDKMRAHFLDLSCVYVLFSILLWCSKLLLGGSVNEKMSPIDILLIWAKPLPTFWYLYVLLAFYLLFSIRCVREMNPVGQVLLFLIISIISNLLDSSWWFQIQRICHYSIFFSVGMALRRGQSIIARSRQFMLSAMLIVASVIAVNLLNIHDLKLNNIPVLNTVAAIGISLFLWSIFEMSEGKMGGVWNAWVYTVWRSMSLTAT